MTNHEYADAKNRHLVIGTGSQAPYGIGEIISTHRTARAAEKAARRWYNAAQVVSPTK